MPQLVIQQIFHFIRSVPRQLADFFKAEQDGRAALKLGGPACAAAQAKVQNNRAVAVPAKDRSEPLGQPVHSAKKRLVRLRQALGTGKGGQKHRQNLKLKVITGDVVQHLLCKAGGDGLRILFPGRQ